MSKNTQVSEIINYLSYDGSGNIVFTTVSAAASNTDKFLVSDAGTLKFRTAAQLLSDIGAQASGSYQTLLTNPVTGTGTSGYLTKWSGSSTVNSSAIYQNGSNIGIGLTNAGALIHTQSNVSGVTEIQGRFENLSIAGRAQFILSSGTYPANFFSLMTHGTSIATSYYASVTGANDAGKAILLGQGTSMTEFVIGTYNSAPLGLFTNNTIRLSFAATGAATFTNRINGVVGGTLYNTAGLWLQGSSSTDGIAIGGTGGGDKTIDTYGGTLKINATAGNGLSVTGAATFSSTVNVSSTATIAYSGLSGDFGAGYTTGLGVGYSSSVPKGINMGWNTTLDMGFIGSVHNGTGWKSLILCPIGGSVYIGATGGNSLYAGPATFSGSVAATVADGGNVGLRVIAGTGRFVIFPYYDATYGVLINSYNTAESGYKPMGFQASAYYFLQGAATFSGSLTGSTALFNVNASSSITLTAGGTDASLIKAGPGDELYIGGNDTWQMRLSGGNILMDNGGNVGINTGIPTARLDINGDVRYRGGIYDQFNFVATGNYTNGTYYNIIGVGAIASGIYILQGEIDTYAVGGGIYFMRFVSVPFYMWDVGSNSVTFVDLPPVLGTGHHLGNAFPLFRLQMTGGGTGIFLQFNPNVTWAGLDNVSGGKSFRVNLKRIG